MKRGTVITALTSLMLLSCGQQQQRLKVTYLSDPPGGTLYKQNGELWGACPKVLWYDLNEEAIAAGKLEAKGLVVRWPTGSEKRSDDVIVFALDRTEQQYVFAQSEDSPAGQHMPELTGKKTDTGGVESERDAGLREEPDEPTVATTKTTRTGAPNAEATEDRIEVVRAGSEQEPGLRGESAEPRGPAEESTKTADSGGEAAERQTDVVPAKFDRDPGLRGESDEKDGPAEETTMPPVPVNDTSEEQADVARTDSEQDTKLEEEPEDPNATTTETAEATGPDHGAKPEQTDAAQTESQDDPGLIEERDEEKNQATDVTETAGAKDGIIERQAGTGSAADLGRGTESGQTPVPEKTPDLILKAPEDLRAETVQVKTEIKDFGFDNGVQMKFAKIPPGVFVMGSGLDADGDGSDKSPARRVRISKSFWIGVYEVTQQQYERVMGANPSRFNGEMLPVERVSWKDAQMFCERLSSTSLGRCRLPTEAEWEYACRAGTTTAYYWGDDFDRRYAWTIEDREMGTHNVGTRLPNAWGLHDMSGNVWEWCSDWYGEYEPSLAELIDPPGPTTGNFRVLRGGSWGHGQQTCRSAHRNWHTPNHRYDDCGFRIVLEPGQTSIETVETPLP